MPPAGTAPPRPPCRRPPSRSSPPSFSSQRKASPPTGTSCAASPAWAASSPAGGTESPAGKRSGKAGSSSPSSSKASNSLRPLLQSNDNVGKGQPKGTVGIFQLSRSEVGNIQVNGIGFPIPVRLLCYNILDLFIDGILRCPATHDFVVTDAHRYVRDRI